jgi:hypothetical protein
MVNIFADEANVTPVLTPENKLLSVRLAPREYSPCSIEPGYLIDTIVVCLTLNKAVIRNQMHQDSVSVASWIA